MPIIVASLLFSGRALPEKFMQRIQKVDRYTGVILIALAYSTASSSISMLLSDNFVTVICI